jgi:hypothetical protein
MTMLIIVVTMVMTIVAMTIVVDTEATAAVDNLLCMKIGGTE